MEYIDGQVCQYFNLYEFRSRDNNVMLINASTIAHIRRMNKLREKLGKPMIIDSGYRTPEFNIKVGGSPNSQHLLGIACDVPISVDVKALPLSERNLYMNKLRDLWLGICKEDGIGGGFGYYDTFNHFDSRMVQSVFDKRTTQSTSVQVKTNGYVKYVEIEPLTLHYVNLTKKPTYVRDLKEEYPNFTNGPFFFPGTRPIYLIVQDGVKLFDLKTWDYLKGKKGTFIIYKDGSVKVMTIHSIADVSNIHLAFQGFNLDYDANGIKPNATTVEQEQINMNNSILKEGFASDVYRPCTRVGYGYNGKKIIIANVYGDANMIRKVIRNLGGIQNGSTFGVGIDSGSRNAFVVDGAAYSDGGNPQEGILTF